MNKPLRLLLCALCLSLAACTHVEAWERGTLAQPHMALDPAPHAQSLRRHTYSSREAAAHADTAAGGGGCGCY